MNTKKPQKKNQTTRKMKNKINKILKAKMKKTKIIIEDRK